MSTDKPCSIQNVVYVSATTSVADADQFRLSVTPETLFGDEPGVQEVVIALPVFFLLSPRTPGLQPGSIWARDDFDEPLSDEFWAGDE